MSEVRNIGGLYIEVSFKSLATPVGRQDQLHAIRERQNKAPGGAVFVGITCTPSECGFPAQDQERVLGIVQDELALNHLTEVVAVEDGVVKTILVFTDRQDDARALKVLEHVFNRIGVALAFANVIPGKAKVERSSALDVLNCALTKRHSRFRVSEFLTQQ